ncbi:MAG: YihY/virulence factor BrkB family protein, partial [Acidobacteriaceae bacterium]|nr:YihY/virulence factor BrkB family protein [Acidobacteriaceae bacterium]
MTRQTLIELLKLAAGRWKERNAPRLGASLAYYALLSLAPLLVLLVAIGGLVFKQNAEEHLVSQITAVAGYSSAKTVQMLLESAHHANGALATVIALVTLLFGASGVFSELRDSLNWIWDAPPRPSSSWRDLIVQRLTSFAMVLALGLLLVVSVVASATMTFVTNFFSGIVPVHFAVLGEIANFVISLAGMVILFALVFKFVPDMPIGWRDEGVGAM